MVTCTELAGGPEVAGGAVWRQHQELSLHMHGLDANSSCSSLRFTSLESFHVIVQHAVHETLEVKSWPH